MMLEVINMAEKSKFLSSNYDYQTCVIVSESVWNVELIKRTQKVL